MPEGPCGELCGVVLRGGVAGSCAGWYCGKPCGVGQRDVMGGGPFYLAATGSFMRVSLQRFSSLGLKSRITARWRVFCRRAIFSAATKIRIGGGTRCCDGRCRRNHSPSRRRRIESDAKDRSRYGRSRRAIPILCEARLSDRGFSKAMPQLFKGGDWGGGEPY